MTSIGDYAMLGDCHGAALVARDGTLAWWWLERFDAPTDPGESANRRAPLRGLRKMLVVWVLA